LGPFAVLLKPFLITIEQGAKTQVKCAVAPELSKETGLYYDDEKTKTPSKLARDVELQDELKKRSDAWVAKYV
jgi:hypothetical protein